MNLVISAPTSEGKTYTVLETLQYFPTKDVRKIGSMYPKVIVRQDSTLVDADTLEPIQYKIDDLKSQIKSHYLLQDLLVPAHLQYDFLE